MLTEGLTGRRRPPHLLPCPVLDAVRRLHHAELDAVDIAVCAHCLQLWPCATWTAVHLAALDHRAE